MGLSVNQVADLISGTLEINPRLAEKLHQTLGGPAQFWLRREANFRANCTRLSAQDSLNQK